MARTTGDKRRYRPVLVFSLAWVAISLLLQDWILALLAGLVSLGLLQHEIPWGRRPNAQKLAVRLLFLTELSFVVFVVIYAATSEHLAPAVASAVFAWLVIFAILPWRFGKARREGRTS
jgi:hypothetical protein